MGLLELLKKIEDTYINNLPNIAEMKRLCEGMGWDPEYRYGFCKRWWNWICFNDCKYILLGSNHDDMRGYTSQEVFYHEQIKGRKKDKKKNNKD